MKQHRFRSSRTPGALVPLFAALVVVGVLAAKPGGLVRRVNVSRLAIHIVTSD